MLFRQSGILNLNWTFQFKFQIHTTEMIVLCSNNLSKIQKCCEKIKMFFRSIIFQISYLNLLRKNPSPLGYAARSGGSGTKYHSREMRITR